MGKKGIEIRLNTIIKRTDKIANGYRLTLSDGTVLETDLVMYAIGRIPNTGGMGLEAAGSHSARRRRHGQ